MSILTAAQARNLLVVDLGGKQIEHVKQANPEKCWLEIYTINECVPGYDAMFQLPDGSWEYRDWTPVVTRLGDGSAPEFLTHTRTMEYDLVDKNTGEIVTEARFCSEDEENGNNLEPTFNDDFDRIDKLLGG